MANSAGDDDASDDEKMLHFLIITVKEADVSRYLKENSVWIKFKDVSSLTTLIELRGGKEECVETQFYHDGWMKGPLQWNFVTRFAFAQKSELPSSIRFTIKDYIRNCAVGILDYDTQQYETYTQNQAQPPYLKVALSAPPDDDDEESDDDDDDEEHDENGEAEGYTITMGVHYVYASAAGLSQQMMDSRMEIINELYEEMEDHKRLNMTVSCADWIDDNRALLLKLLRNQDLKVTAGMHDEDFSDMVVCPLLYEDIPGHGGCNAFLWNYRRIQEMQHKFRIYADDTSGFDVVYYARPDAAPFGGLDITEMVQCMFRYVFLRDILLAGQDSNFNVYRSYYLDPRRGKIALAMLALILQLILTAAIVYEVYASWDALVEQHDPFIMVASVMVFSFLSYMTNNTANAFREFYEHIGLAYDIPWLLLVCDFVSNIVISLLICLLALFFLLQSETPADVVLNAFALTFISELDDMANVFESDTEPVIVADLNAFLKTQCENPRRITWDMRSFGLLLRAPVMAMGTVWVAVVQIVNLFIRQKHKNSSEETLETVDDKGDYWARAVNRGWERKFQKPNQKEESVESAAVTSAQDERAGSTNNSVEILEEEVAVDIAGGDTSDVPQDNTEEMHVE